MAQIKVTGYVDTDDLNPRHVDLTHTMGVSNEGFEYFGVHGIEIREDLEFELVED